MTLLVQKYGGTSVGGLNRMIAVAERIIGYRRRGIDVAVVLSAMAGETDRLIHQANQLQAEPDPRDLDMLLATGEQASVALLALALKSRGCASVSLTGAQAGVNTDDCHGRARLLNIDTERLRGFLDAGIVPVVAGFQGVTAQGEITTIGRGGSDTSAVALAAALNADECQIYTDVEGVYTTDPRVVPQARLLSHVTFEEMLELAGSGTKVLQNRAVAFAGRYQVPLRVCSAFRDGEDGTLISYEQQDMEAPRISGLAFNRDEAKLTIRGIPDAPGMAHEVLAPMAAAGVEIDMIVENRNRDGRADLSFTIHRADYGPALRELQAIAERLGAVEVSGDENIAKISLVGVGIRRSHAGIASRLCQVLGEEGISVQMMSTSEIKISVAVAEKYLELGVRALHEAFGLENEATASTIGLPESRARG